MKPVVFLGPSLQAVEARALLDADVRPPAAQGDVFRAVTAGAPAIGLVDGLFGDGPTVWHREILWALAQGRPVYGAASMGALRAAELADFGMIGVGRIYRAYREGALEADDAVAVTHAPPEFGSAPLSVALVDIAASLRLAARRGVIPRGLQRRLEGLAAALNFRERSFERLLAMAAAELPGAPLAALATFLAEKRVSLKAQDARALLRRMAREGRRHWPAPRVAFAFQETQHWRAAVRQWTAGR